MNLAITVYKPRDCKRDNIHFYQFNPICITPMLKLPEPLTRQFNTLLLANAYREQKNQSDQQRQQARNALSRCIKLM